MDEPAVRPAPAARVLVVPVAAALLAVAGCTVIGTAGGSAPAPTAASRSVPAQSVPAPTPQRSPLTAFGVGSYLVGRDVAPARYRPSGDCAWVQRGADGGLLDRSGPSRPTPVVLTLTTTGSVLVVTGPSCRFTRV